MPVLQNVAHASNLTMSRVYSEANAQAGWGSTNGTTSRAERRQSLSTFLTFERVSLPSFGTQPAFAISGCGGPQVSSLNVPTKQLILDAGPKGGAETIAE
jgi:hypothetical protein